jgi:hypothetical protein
LARATTAPQPSAVFFQARETAEAILISLQAGDARSIRAAILKRKEKMASSPNAIEGSVALAFKEPGDIEVRNIDMRPTKSCLQSGANSGNPPRPKAENLMAPTL